MSNAPGGKAVTYGWRETGGDPPMLRVRYCAVSPRRPKSERWPNGFTVDLERLAQAVMSLRARHSMTQDALRERMGLGPTSRYAVSRIESAYSDVSLSTLITLGEALELGKGIRAAAALLDYAAAVPREEPVRKARFPRT